MASALQSIFAVYVGNAETARDNLFGDYFPVWPEDDVWPGNSWSDKRAIKTMAYNADQTTDYYFDGISDDPSNIDIAFSRKLENIVPSDPTVAVEFSGQDSDGLIEYTRNEIFPSLQLHRNDYAMSQFAVRGDKKELVSKADVKIRTRIALGEEFFNQVAQQPDAKEEEREDPFAGLNAALEAQRIVDEANQSAQETLDQLPDVNEAIQNANQTMEYIKSMEQGLQEQQKYQNFMNNMQPPDDTEDSDEGWCIEEDGSYVRCGADEGDE